MVEERHRVFHYGKTIGLDQFIVGHGQIKLGSRCRLSNIGFAQERAFVFRARMGEARNNAHRHNIGGRAENDRDRRRRTLGGIKFAGVRQDNIDFQINQFSREAGEPIFVSGRCR